MQMNVLRTKQVSHVGNRDDHGQPIAGGNGQRIVYVYRMKANLMNCEYLSDLFHKIPGRADPYQIMQIRDKSSVCAPIMRITDRQDICPTTILHTPSK